MEVVGLTCIYCLALSLREHTGAFLFLGIPKDPKTKAKKLTIWGSAGVGEPERTVNAWSND